MRKLLATLMALALVALALTGCRSGWIGRLFPGNTSTDTLYTSPDMNVAQETWDGSGYSDTEEYSSVGENGFLAASTNPVSAFAADVDTASYCNLRRMIYAGCAPEDIPTGAIRTEELLGYFAYSDPAPAPGGMFSVSGQASACPWNPDTVLLRLGIRAQEAMPAVAGTNLVFLVDVSGSMAGDRKLPLVKEALRLLADSLTERDTLSIVTYSSGETVLLSGANPTKDRSEILRAVDSLAAEGSTNGQRGLAQAYDVAQSHYIPDGNNRIVLCTDGDLNVGMTSESELTDYVSGKRETGIYLTVLGFGDGNYKDNKLESLADNGNGNYFYIDSITEAKKVLLEELTATLITVADDVKLQVEFNPARVKGYRLIGYENRALTDGEFQSDATDAGEVGSGDCLTALYEIALADSRMEIAGSTLKYGAPSSSGSGEWLTLTVRYRDAATGEAGELIHTVSGSSLTDQPGDDWKFCAAVTEFSMLLQKSEYAGTSSFASVLELLNGTNRTDPYRDEFASLVKLIARR